MTNGKIRSARLWLVPLAVSDAEEMVEVLSAAALYTFTGGQAVGYVQATVVDGGRQAEIAWVIGVDWQGRGYATEAARALVAWLDSRGVTTIRAHIHPGHAASAAVARRAGLAPTGHVGEGEQLWQRDQPG